MIESTDLDAFISSTYPVIPVPSQQELPILEGHGVRYMVAADGLWRELRWPWVYAKYPMLTNADLALPYGAISECVTFKFASPPPALWRAFIADAKAAFPLEAAGALIWNEKDLSWRYAQRKALQAKSDFIEYEEVSLGEDEHLVVDIHSHGRHLPFFSSTDDQDDKGSVKISVVFGCLDAEPSWVMRLNLLDRKVAMSLDSDFNFKVEPFDDSCHS